VLVITDVKGGTPANCCNRLADAGRVEVIAGISLPMLLRAITYRRDTLDVVVEMALAARKVEQCASITGPRRCRRRLQCAL
jgi:PTS system ascorbate-specific IIA component